MRAGMVQDLASARSGGSGDGAGRSVY
jgi:hypothetical protein